MEESRPPQATRPAEARFAPVTAPAPAAAPVLIRFGDGPNELMPVEWAEGILRQARAEKPVWFKRWFAEAALANGATPAGQGK